MSNNVLFFAEKADPALELVTAACAIADGGAVVGAVVNDAGLANAVAEAGCKVFDIKQDGLVLADAAGVAGALKALAEKEAADVILFPSDRRGRLVGSYLAQILGAAFLSNTDKAEVDGDSVVYTRNILGGMLCAEQEAATEKAVVAVSAKVYDKAAPADGGSVETFEANVEAGGVELKSVDAKDASVADISEAEILVVVGQGVAKDDLDKVAAIADKVGGLVGCTKPVATDKKWYSEEQVVGISGKICKPSLALLFGVSGQVQFYTGIRDAKIVAAVDKDENALITELADYYFVGDSAQAIPAVQAAL